MGLGGAGLGGAGLGGAGLGRCGVARVARCGDGAGRRGAGWPGAMARIGIVLGFLFFWGGEARGGNGGGRYSVFVLVRGAAVFAVCHIALIKLSCLLSALIRNEPTSSKLNAVQGS